LLPSTERIQLDATSWVDVGRGWLPDADEALGVLLREVEWKASTVWRYDHAWEEPRLSGWVRPGIHAPHQSITRIHKQLRSAYGVELGGTSLVQYRDGRDSMAPHRDDDLRWTAETLVAIVSLGATRPWTLAPRTEKQRIVMDIAPGHGDVLVMGGRAQADWVHGVPKAPGVTDARLSLQWRWTSKRGQPERGGGSAAPRHYGGGR
jgi:alkylated DNA repair dioxygenase AlkB